MSDGFDAGRAAVEDAGDGREVLSVLRIKTELIDLELMECGFGDRQIEVTGASAC